MKIAVLDPASGIAGDMFIGALVDVGLDKAWLERLPLTLGLTGVEVRIADVQRSRAPSMVSRPTICICTKSERSMQFLISWDRSGASSCSASSASTTQRFHS